VTSKDQKVPPRTWGWGGKREGAGRKPGKNPKTPHRARAGHLARYPVRLTLRLADDIDPRQGVVANRIGVALGELKADEAQFRVVEYGIQTPHVHFIVEAADGEALMSGARGIAVRLALGINKSLGRSGRVFVDRYRTKTLKTAQEVRDALVFVLLDSSSGKVNPASSARWFTGFKQPAAPSASSPVSPARTALLTEGWRSLGLL
jgi:hypothetical protein